MGKQYKYSNRKLCQDIKLIWTTNLNFSVLSMMKIIRMNYDKKKNKKQVETNQLWSSGKREIYPRL